MEKITELLELIKQNPGLPIVPMVDSEIVADDGYNRWLGSWGQAHIDEYLIGADHLHFKEDDDIEDVLSDVIGYKNYEAMTDEQAKEAYDALEWVRAIIVNIDLPD